MHLLPQPCACAGPAQQRGQHFQFARHVFVGLGVQCQHLDPQALQALVHLVARPRQHHIGLQGHDALDIRIAQAAYLGQ
ncbi:hypothetical protein D3C72_2369940 [compost metagenome]